MSFSCPHFNPNNDRCDRARARCVPGRRGCVLAGNSTFAVPPLLRVEAAEREERRVAERKARKG
jgi:hypothetical protein